MPTLVSRVVVGSLLAYTPRPVTDEGSKARNLMYALKNDQRSGSPPRPLSEVVAQYLALHLDRLPFSDLFGPDTLAVPVPKSSLTRPGSLWVPFNLATAFHAVGLVTAFSACARRTKAIRKAATSPISERPTALEHFDSIQIVGGLLPAARFLLVDDVVTRGATIIGVASRLAEAYPGAEIKAFAAIRTVSNPAEFVTARTPAVEVISLEGSQSFRRPI